MADGYGSWTDHLHKPLANTHDECHGCEVAFAVFRCASKNSTIAGMFGATTSLCSPPGTSMYLSSAPSSFSFATIVRDPETATVGSASPWTMISGTLRIF